MADRLDLQELLERMLGSSNVYYQPPENVKIKYPAIIYSKDGIDDVPADDTKYLINKSYEIIVVDRRPDNPVIDKLLSLPLSRYDRSYVHDNLHHDVIILYY